MFFSLSKKNDMVSGYELSNILSIRYDKGNLPSNAQLLTEKYCIYLITKFEFLIFEKE